MIVTVWEMEKEEHGFVGGDSLADIKGVTKVEYKDEVREELILTMSAGTVKVKLPAYYNIVITEDYPHLDRKLREEAP